MVLNYFTTVNTWCQHANHPKKYGTGSRACRICNTSHGLIRKYHLNICRRCFRENATDIGFIKVAMILFYSMITLVCL
jgi:small subunit ribosomal protein S29e